MSKGYLDIESLDTLIRAVNEYREGLATNIATLKNAANVCDQAMGSDEISKKYIGELNNALVELDKTAQITEKVAQELKKDRKKALEPLDT